MSASLQRNVSLASFVTLRSGGAAEYFALAETREDICELFGIADSMDSSLLVLGFGSNVLPSAAGVAGLTILNRSRQITVLESGFVEADSGAILQDVFLAAAQRGFSGFEFAVGIPGTLGGALVSNAGAYRSAISEHLVEVEVYFDGVRRWVDPSWMEFSYRDSAFRRPNPLRAAILAARFRLPRRSQREIFGDAREYQRQRIGKQPPPASAGSFFKNVVSQELARELPGLSAGMRENGVVPAGYLIEGAGLKGYSHEGAMFGRRHANFILNVGGAEPGSIRQLAEIARRAVQAKYGVLLEEEVLYVGDWSSWSAA